MRRITRLYLGCCWMFGAIQALASLVYALPSSAEEISSTNPIRISRDFVRSPLFGKISIGSNNPGMSITSSASPVLWIEYPSTDPTPQPGAIADFRDHLGCAYFNGATDSVAVCFNMMGDVSTLGVNSREMRLMGVEEYIRSSYPISDSSIGQTCQPQRVESIRFQGASGSEGAIELLFAVDAVPKEDCRISSEPLKIKLQLSAREVLSNY